MLDMLSQDRKQEYISYLKSMPREQLLKEFQSIAVKEHISTGIYTKLKLEVDGQEKHSEICHTLNRNWQNGVPVQFGAGFNAGTFGAGVLNFKDTSGNAVTTRWFHQTYTISAPYNNLESTTYAIGMMGAAGAVTRGIIVGTGTNAASPEDYVLQTPIAHGTGAGQLKYIITPPPLFIWTVGTRTQTIRWWRYFDNFSGSDITINEVAIYALVNPANTNPANSSIVMMNRDKLAVGVTVTHLQQLKVTYDFSMVIPS